MLLGDHAKPLTEEEQQDLERLSRFPSSKMNSGDLSKYSVLCTRNDDWARTHFRQWLDEDPGVQQALALDQVQMRAHLAAVEALAEFDPDARLSHHPSQEELQRAIGLKHNKLLGLTYYLIRYEAIHARLRSLLENASDYWSSLVAYSKTSEWQAKGGLYSFDLIKRLIRLRDLSSEVLRAAKSLQLLLSEGHAMESRLVEIRRQQMELKE